MSPNNKKSLEGYFEKLIAGIKTGLRAIGQDPNMVRTVKKGWLVIEGTGIEVIWLNQIDNSNRAGWALREVTRITSIDTDVDEMEEHIEILFVSPGYDYHGTAYQTVLAVASRVVEAAFDGIDFDD